MHGGGIKIDGGYNGRLINNSLAIGVSLLAFVAIAVFVFSMLAPWHGDDIAYQYMFGPAKVIDGYYQFNDFSRPVKNIGDVVESMSCHYYTINGRYVAHFLVQCFSGILGRTAFAVANGVVYVLFIMLLLRMCGTSWRNPRSLLTAVPLVFIFFSTGMTPPAQVSYIWMFTLDMWFLTLFFSRRRWKGWQIPLLCLAALAAGNSHESLVTGLSVALIIYWARHIRTVTGAQWAMLICFGIGVLAVCLSPAALKRASDYRVSNVYSVMQLIGSPKAVVLFLAVLVAMLFRKKFSLRRFYTENRFFANTLLTLIAFNAVVGIENPRQLFGIELCALILLIAMMPRKGFSTFWICCCWAFLAFFFVMQARVVMTRKKVTDSIEAQYAISTDGKVYFERPAAETPLNMEAYAAPPSFSTPTDGTAKGNGNYNDRMLKCSLYHKYPGHPYLQALPAELRGKERINLGNRVIRCADGSVLLVQSKEHPAAFRVEYGMKAYGLRRPWFSQTVKGNPLKTIGDSPLWNAYYVGAPESFAYVAGAAPVGF